MKRSEAIGNLSKALSAMNGEIEDTEKTNEGYKFDYSNLHQVLNVIRPLLAKNNLSFTQHTSIEENKVLITSLLMHESGEWIESTLSMPIAKNGQNEMHSIGSAITYGRRYATAAIFSITQYDSDGNKVNEDDIEKAKDEQKKTVASPQQMQKHFEQKQAAAPASKPTLLKSHQTAVDDIKLAYQANDHTLCKFAVEKLDEPSKKVIWANLGEREKNWIKEIVSK